MTRPGLRLRLDSHATSDRRGSVQACSRPAKIPLSSRAAEPPPIPADRRDVQSVTDEGVLDPWVAEWFAANPMVAKPFDDLSPEILPLARGPVGAPPTREIAKVTDEVVDGCAGPHLRARSSADRPRRVPPRRRVLHRQHRVDGQRRARARALLRRRRRVGRVSPRARAPLPGRSRRLRSGYPLGPRQHRALRRDAATKSRSRARAPAATSRPWWHSGSAATPTRRSPARCSSIPSPTARSATHASRDEFDGIVITTKPGNVFREAYLGGRDVDADPFVAPLQAESLAGLPPAIVVLGGCDPLRDEGRLYARRLQRRRRGCRRALLRGSAARVRELRLPGHGRRVRAHRAVPSVGRSSDLAGPHGSTRAARPLPRAGLVDRRDARTARRAIARRPPRRRGAHLVGDAAVARHLRRDPGRGVAARHRPDCERPRTR